MKIARRTLLTLLFFPWSFAFYGLGTGRQNPQPSEAATWEMDAPASQPPANEASTPSPSPLLGIPYLVLKGDTVQKLAAIFLVTEKSIRQINGLTPDEEVSPGQVIQIPPDLER